jgi:hypothetical protein
VTCRIIVSCELVLVLIVVNYAGYTWSIYIMPVLEAPCMRRQPKQPVEKINKKNYYIHRIIDEYKSYIRCLADKYMNHGSVGWPRDPIYWSVNNKYI